MPAVRTALSNDYPLAMQGLAAMIAPFGDTVEIVEVTTDLKRFQDVDVILFDTFGRLPRDDHKLREIVRLNDAKVVVYSWDLYPKSEALAGGAAGYIHKGVSASQLVEAIVAIHEGRATDSCQPDYVASCPGNSDAEIHTWPGQAQGLTARESEILTFVARGLSNQEIADSAYISVNTVKTYLRTGYRKIGVTRRSQAVAWAIANGFLPG
jgi:NarL family two-component system response regulator LiaR